MFRSPLIAVALGLAALGAARAGVAGNLVANPGFETADFTGWTVTGDGIAIDTVFPNTGCCDAVFTATTTDPNPGMLSQAVATTPGQDYALGFALLDEAGFSGDAFTVDFGGFSTVITGDEAAPPGDLPSFYTAFAFTVPGADITSATTTLSFEGLSDPTIGIDWNLDDIAVTAVSIPEPPITGLVLAALAFILCAAGIRAAR